MIEFILFPETEPDKAYVVRKRTFAALVDICNVLTNSRMLTDEARGYYAELAGVKAADKPANGILDHYKDLVSALFVDAPKKYDLADLDLEAVQDGLTFFLSRLGLTTYEAQNISILSTLIRQTLNNPTNTNGRADIGSTASSES